MVRYLAKILMILIMMEIEAPCVVRYRDEATVGKIQMSPKANQATIKGKRRK